MISPKREFIPVSRTDKQKPIDRREFALSSPARQACGCGSEERFTKVFHANPHPMCVTTLAEGKFIDVNEGFLKALGYQRQEIIGHTSLELGFWPSPADRGKIVEALKHDRHVRNLETTIHRRDGESRVWLSSVEVIELDGQDCVLVASSDITERKQADARLRDLSGRLIRAQEEERSRIARELHDNLNQQLALLSTELEQLVQHSSPRAHLETKVRVLTKRVQEISSLVHHMSYQLHPSRLDYLGLVPALRALCRDVSEASGPKIDFRESNVPEGIPKDVALCLFRVAQESLRNAVRHSGAASVLCELCQRKGLLDLTITDSGTGFELEAARAKGGLGLVSMEERLRSVGGELVIRSRPLRGTQIEARIAWKDNES